MKKILFFIFLSLLCSTAYAKENVIFSKCIDGDTAWFKYNSETIKVRFLAINTPEYTTKIEPLGLEASEFTCNKLKSAKKIELEFDKNSDQKDKYERYLAWVFVDDKLLQDLIISEGLGKVEYLYDNYKYTNILKQSELKAKTQKKGIWQDDYTIEITIISIIAIVIILILCLVSKKFRNIFISNLNKRRT